MLSLVQRFWTLVIVGTLCVQLWGADQWPQFRGAAARGVSDNPSLPDQWSATENVAWKTDIEGRGWSSPIVWDDQVFLTTVINSGTTEEPKKGLYFGGERSEPPVASHTWHILCLNLGSGEVLWDRKVHEGQPATSIHIKNSYASETPVTDGSRVYAYFGNVGIFCCDLQGNLLWSKQVEARKTRFSWGPAASPVLHQGCLYLVNDNDESSYLLALDAETGSERWRVARDEKSNWSTPFIWQHEGGTEIVTPGSGQVRSYDLNGELLWWLEGMSSITIATPYEYQGQLYLSSGYVMDRMKPIYAIRPGARGDISLKEGATSNDFIVWSQPGMAPYNPSTLIYDGRLYVLYDMGLLACLNAADGSVIYDRTRIPRGRGFTTSPWAYRGKIFCLNEDGQTFVVRAGDTFELLHVNTLADDDMGMATPALAGDRLLIRTAARVYCIRNASR